MKNIFQKQVTEEVISRINQITSDTKPQWGKMNAAQVMAHCSVTYEYAFTDKYRKPNAFTKFMLKLFVKNAVVGPKSYPQNGRTAPDFVISDERNFEEEKTKLVDYIKKTQELGETHFDNKESHSFGKLSKEEWNNMFYKHIDHHLTQFGA